MNRNAKKRIFPLILLLSLSLVQMACERQEPLDTTRDTYSDELGDITFLNDAFYSTNHDLSGNAGSQIDLLRFEWGTDQVYLDDHFDLDMNGQGYLAITNDSMDVYLQSRTTELIIKCSSVGEKVHAGYDDLQSNWHPAGISYHPDKDSLLVLYRNSDHPQSYRLRTLDPDLIGPESGDQSFELDFAGLGVQGIYALAYHHSGLFMLGVDTTDTDILIIADHSLRTFTSESIPDSMVTGLCFKADDLFLSYGDRRIAYWATYPPTQASSIGLDTDLPAPARSHPVSHGAGTAG